jgi:CO/xanthine dehydrogenase Mo-binding subunit
MSRVIVRLGTHEELAAVFDPVEAFRPEAPILHEGLAGYVHAPMIDPIPGTNVCNHFHLETGNAEEGFAASDEIFEDTFSTPPQQHCTIEPHGAICSVDGEDNLTLWANNDSPYRARKEIASALKLRMNKVRVIVPEYVGGNFGSKGGLKAEACAIALAWKIRNRPIRVIFTREEEFCSAIVRHAATIRIRTGVRRDGTILARTVEVYLSCGAYAEKGPTVTLFAGLSAAGPHRIPNVRIDSDSGRGRARADPGDRGRAPGGSPWRPPPRRREGLGPGRRAAPYLWPRCWPRSTARAARCWDGAFTSPR